MRFSPPAAFLTLCILSSSEWLIDTLLPSSAPAVPAQGLRFLLVAVLGLILRSVFPPTETRWSWRHVRAGVAGFALLGVPLLLTGSARERVAVETSVLVFSLVPLIVALVLSVTGEESLLPALLPWGVLGSAAILVLLPVRLPVSGSEYLGLGLLLLAAIAAGGSMVWLHAAVTGVSLIEAVTAICLISGTALVLAHPVSVGAMFSLRESATQGIRALCVDLPEALLVVHLLKLSSPGVLSARYFLAPLLSFLQGLVLVRPHIDFRTGVGVCLLALSTVQVVRSYRAMPSSALTLRQP